MDYEKLFEILDDRPGEWVRFEGRKASRREIHFFKGSRKGGQIVHHKISPEGAAEGFTREGFQQAYHGWSWHIKAN